LQVSPNIRGRCDFRDEERSSRAGQARPKRCFDAPMPSHDHAYAPMSKREQVATGERGPGAAAHCVPALSLGSIQREPRLAMRGDQAGRFGRSGNFPGKHGVNASPQQLGNARQAIVGVLNQGKRQAKVLAPECLLHGIDQGRGQRVGQRLQQNPDQPGASGCERPCGMIRQIAEAFCRSGNASPKGFAYECGKIEGPRGRCSRNAGCARDIAESNLLLGSWTMDPGSQKACGIGCR